MNISKLLASSATPPKNPPSCQASRQAPSWLLSIGGIINAPNREREVRSFNALHQSQQDTGQTALERGHNPSKTVRDDARMEQQIQRAVDKRYRAECQRSAREFACGSLLATRPEPRSKIESEERCKALRLRVQEKITHVEDSLEQQIQRAVDKRYLEECRRSAREFACGSILATRPESRAKIEAQERQKHSHALNNNQGK